MNNKENTTIMLYSYWRSSAAYRVRIALNLKQLDYQTTPVHLVKNGGEQHSEVFHEMNPSELVPVLKDGDLVLNQSMTIMDYLDETYSGHPLIPSNGEQRYTVKALAQDVAIDIHPINNLRVLQYLEQECEMTAEHKQSWYKHWIGIGFEAFETKLKHSSGLYCVGDEITLADICLVPQVYNAIRFGVDMTPFPTIESIYERCNQQAAFIDAMPENQIDAE